MIKNGYIFLVAYSSINIVYVSKVKLGYSAVVYGKVMSKTHLRISLKAFTSKTGGIWHLGKPKISK